MTKTQKQFRVADISKSANGDGLFGHLLVSEDGECWQVELHDTPPQYERGKVVEVPLVQQPGERLRPDWKAVGIEKASEMQLKTPYETVAAIWGKEAAERFHTPTKRSKSKLLPPNVMFKTEHFIATATHPVSEKVRFANQFTRFIVNNCDSTHFPVWFYNLLTGIGLWGFKPSRSHTTFYNEWFETADQRAAFIKQIAGSKPIGDPSFNWSDVEMKLKGWVIQSGLQRRYDKSGEHAQSVQEREILRHLLEKHGCPADWRIL